MLATKDNAAESLVRFSSSAKRGSEHFSFNELEETSLDEIKGGEWRCGTRRGQIVSSQQHNWNSFSPSISPKCNVPLSLETITMNGNFKQWWAIKTN